MGFLGLLLLRQSARHAALICSWMSLLGLYYGSLFNKLGMLPAVESVALCHGVLLVIGLGLVAILWWLPGELKSFSSFVSLTAAIVLAVFSLNFGLELSRQFASSLSDIEKTFPLPAEVASPDEGHPDIYYLVLDGYGRGDVLQKYYGFDNAEFLDGLRQRGFYIADKSSTNYPSTVFSLPSSLNMRYHELIDRRGGGLNCWPEWCGRTKSVCACENGATSWFTSTPVSSRRRARTSHMCRWESKRCYPTVPAC